MSVLFSTEFDKVHATSVTARYICAAVSNLDPYSTGVNPGSTVNRTSRKLKERGSDFILCALPGCHSMARSCSPTVLPRATWNEKKWRTCSDAELCLWIQDRYLSELVSWTKTWVRYVMHELWKIRWIAAATRRMSQR